ncbi:MAG: ATP-binding protein [Verrucomicrobiota bacterium]
MKWRLQLWYGLILLVVLVGFGGTAYQLERNRQLRRIDAELHRRIGVVGNALHRPAQRDFNGGGPPVGPPPHGRDPQDLPFDAPPPEQLLPDGSPERDFRRPKDLVLREQDARFFDPADPNKFYFVIIGRDGNELAHSTNTPPLAADIGQARAELFERSEAPRLKANPLQLIREFGSFRESRQQLPSGEMICAGCSIAPELKELRVVAATLAGVGGTILLLGLAGGWWIVVRALKPIENISAAAVKISAGELSRRIDITEARSELGQLASVLNATFARLETAFAQQQRFVSDAAHELRTPVSVILTQTQLALARERDAAAYRQTIEACQRAAQRMRRLIESLLELARFDAGQETMKRLPFDFAKTVSDGVELVQPLAQERGVTLVSEVYPLEILGDSDRLSQVVVNLLINAIQFNQAEGKVFIELRKRAGLAALSIANTGRGIGPEDLPRVFERFYRADKSRTGAGNSGLGLSICKAIVEAHGGTIEVASEVNVQTTFTLHLPAA